MNLTKKELLKLFNASVDNSKHLFDAAVELSLRYNKNKFPSLGLAELALEELGKSYSCLAIYSKDQKKVDWKVFWKDWKDHELKAHRAFFYEFFCLLRLEIQDLSSEIELIPRGSFSKEKEVSFYVDISKSNRHIHIPAKEIDDKECIARTASLLGLINASYHVKDWLNSTSSQSFKNAISDYAYLTLTTNMYQQDIEKMLHSMRIDDTEYNSGLDAIWNLFSNAKSEI